MPKCLTPTHTHAVSPLKESLEPPEARVDVNQPTILHGGMLTAGIKYLFSLPTARVSAAHPYL